MRRLLLLVWLATVACAGAAQPVSPARSANVHTMANPAVSFDRFKTFSIGLSEGPPAGYQATARTAEVYRRLRPLIASALAARGYTQVDARGDLLVMYGSGVREVAIHETSSVGAGWLPDDENADFVEGSLVIDAFDGASYARVWHGASRAEIKPEQIDDQRLQRSVQELIGAFPQAKAAAAQAP
jgi:hypothetical protein